jgi:hypothetical protein
MGSDGVAEIRHHFGVVAEGLRDEIRTVAEGLTVVTENLALVTENLAMVTENLATFRQEVRDEFGRVHRDSAETREMLQRSHGELERRIVDLESHR